MGFLKNLFSNVATVPKGEADPTGNFLYEVLPDNHISIAKYIGSSAEVEIPSTIENQLVLYIGDSAFKNCRTLKSVAIPDSIMTIGKSAFACCEALTDVSIPDGVITIADAAFSSCTSLTRVTIPKSVDNIFDEAFQFCSSLVSVKILSERVSIYKYAFMECTSLEDVVLPEKGSIRIDADAFDLGFEDVFEPGFEENDLDLEDLGLDNSLSEESKKNINRYKLDSAMSDLLLRNGPRVY
jgi:hypothetical protein